MAEKVGVVRGEIFLKHDPGWGHPECPERLVSIYGMLDQSGLSQNLAPVELRKAEKSEILLIHSERHYQDIASTRGKSSSYLDPDTSTSPDSFDAALYAVGGLLNLVEKVLEGELSSGFALIRPPGHHAERERAMGFCLFNNIAIASAWAVKEKGLKRVLVADFDVHHGNGTQHSFYDTDQVLYFSSHRYPFYPGTGYFNEVGEGKGEGFTVNVPLPAGMGDEDYDAIYRELLLPIALEYQPELVLVSAGFDPYYQDPLGGMEVTENGFARLASILMEIAQKSCEGKLVFALEGGYSVEGIARSIQKIMQLLLGEIAPINRLSSPSERLSKILSELKKYQTNYWKGLER